MRSMAVTLVVHAALLVLSSAAAAQQGEPPPQDQGAPILVPITTVDPQQQPAQQPPQQQAQQPAPQTYAPQAPVQYGTQPPTVVVVQSQQSAPGQQLGYQDTGEVETQPRMGLVIGGAIMFGVSYLLNVFTVYVDYDDDGESDIQELLVPVIGPLLLLPDAADGVDTFLIFDSLVQTAGLAMLIIGLAWQREVQPRAEGERPSFALTPTLGRDRAGAAMMLTF